MSKLSVFTEDSSDDSAGVRLLMVSTGAVIIFSELQKHILKFTLLNIILKH